jgi:hypothetical protein
MDQYKQTKYELREIIRTYDIRDIFSCLNKKFFGDIFYKYLYSDNYYIRLLLNGLLFRNYRIDDPLKNDKLSYMIELYMYMISKEKNNSDKFYIDRTKQIIKYEIVYLVNIYFTTKKLNIMIDLLLTGIIYMADSLKLYIIDMLCENMNILKYFQLNHYRLYKPTSDLIPYFDNKINIRFRWMAAVYRATLLRK